MGNISGIMALQVTGLWMIRFMMYMNKDFVIPPRLKTFSPLPWL